jgi:hypothetical protein
MPDVQRLHHGAEIRLDTRRKRRRNRQSGRRLRGAQAQERRTRRRGTEDAEGRRGMPALGIVIHIDRKPDFGLGFKAHHISGYEVLTTGANVVGQRKQRGQDRGRRMPTDRVIAIVKIERMRGGTVNQCRLEGRDAPAVAKQEAGPSPGGKGPGGQAGGVLVAARERGAHGIQDAHLRPVHGLWGQVGEVLRGDAVREFQCESHGSSLVQGSSVRSC